MVLVLTRGVVVLIGLVASIWVHSLAVTSVQFVGVAAAGAAFRVLGRRALSREVVAISTRST